jgi:hypothetical protein
LRFHAASGAGARTVVRSISTFDPSSVARLTLNNSEVTNNRQTLSPEESDNALSGGGIINILGTVTLNGSGVDTNTAMGLWEAASPTATT